MLTAIVREVSARLAECEVSFQERAPIDVLLAKRQHVEYCRVLAELGANVVTLPALDDSPDCVFVEDPIVVLDEVAIVARMGAESRRGESASLAEAVGRYRELLQIEAPGTLEGGDVMRIGKTLYVGISQRTNVAGLQQLARLVAPFGYWVTPVEVRGCLHLKSACCYLGNDTVLVRREWIDMDGFCGLKFVDVADPNALRVGDTVVVAKGSAIEGFRVREVDISEFVKADAGVTCMSVVFEG
jgi:dimethylargininase